LEESLISKVGPSILQVSRQPMDTSDCVHEPQLLKVFPTFLEILTGAMKPGEFRLSKGQDIDQRAHERSSRHLQPSPGRQPESSNANQTSRAMNSSQNPRKLAGTNTKKVSGTSFAAKRRARGKENSSRRRSNQNVRGTFSSRPAEQQPNRSCTVALEQSIPDTAETSPQIALGNGSALSDLTNNFRDTSEQVVQVFPKLLSCGPPSSKSGGVIYLVAGVN
jgi:hypothetical protein